MTNKYKVYQVIHKSLNELSLSDAISVLLTVIETEYKCMIDHSEASMIEYNIDEVERICAVMIDRLRNYAAKDEVVIMSEMREATIH